MSRSADSRALSWSFAFALAALAVLAGWGPARAQSRPFPQHVTYAAGSIAPSQYTQAQQDDHVRAFYQKWKSQFVVAAGTDAQGHPLYRIAFGKPGTSNHASTVSEGQGWGMVVVPLMAGYDADARTIFDGLVRFARKFPSAGDSRLMSWKIRDGAPIQGNASAFDGDADIAYGLILAHRQWGSAGAINYAVLARSRLAGIWQSTIGPESRLPMLGDWVDPAGADYNQWTNRTSDFMPASFEGFRRFEGTSRWGLVSARTRRTTSDLQRLYSPGKGLVPDFVEPISAADTSPRPADPNFLEGPNDGAYGYNACRMPLRTGLDAVHSANALSIASVRRITAWAAGKTAGDPAALRAGYKLDGQPVAGSNYFTTAFAAPLAVAAMSAPDQQAWLDALYDAVKARHENYYEDTITMLTLLITSRNFWRP